VKQERERRKKEEEEEEEEGWRPHWRRCVMSKQTCRYQMGGKQDASGLLHENSDSESKRRE